MKQEFLFVYGTLRKAYGLKLLDDMGDQVEWLGFGRVNAAIFDLGNYPAAVKGTAEDETCGEVYAIKNAAAIFVLLDDYEGEEYKREKVNVKLDDGTNITAWMYWYKGDVTANQRIWENDYLTYLKNIKDRFL